MTQPQDRPVAPLSRRTVGHLDPRVAVPSYDRDEVRVGIVHFGVGGFHRAHEAMYLDRLMNADAGDALDWGICGVGVKPGDAAMGEALTSQDGLYTLVLKHSDGRLEPRVIGSIVRFLFAPDDPAAVLDVLADPATRIVSLTITEGGYNVDPVTVAADLADPESPGTVFGLVVEGLRLRWDEGVPPFTVMSCDNIPGNGDLARRMFAAYADARDPGLGAWVRETVAFPNAMVDRITPVTADADRAALAEEFGVADRWPVVSESFTQWVLQDEFPTGRPAWDEAGVQLVGDVEPYELMKLRLLNAGHQAMCYAGWLAGHRYAHEVATDPVIRQFLSDYMTAEGRPTLPEVPGVDLDAYIDELLHRFANPQVRDTVARLCLEGSDRIPKFLIPVIRANLDSGGPIRRSATVIASWARYMEGVDEQGAPIPIVDRLRDRLTALAADNRSDPLRFIRDGGLFPDLADNERFAAAYLGALESFHKDGALATLTQVNAEPLT